MNKSSIRSTILALFVVSMSPDALAASEVVTVYDARIGRLLPRLACHPKWQSRQMRIGSTVTMAGRFDANPAVLRRESNGIKGSVIRHAPWKLAEVAA